MTVKRIVANIATDDPIAAKRFYGDVLGLDVVMDHGWIVTWGIPSTMHIQIAFAQEGGSGTAVPDLSIEVTDIEQTLAAMVAAGFKIEYGPATESWGVRRFYVRDPFGRLVNIVQHI